MRASRDFAFEDQLRSEQAALRAHYGKDGELAASILDDTRKITQLVTQAALSHLVALGVHWTPRPQSPATSALKAKIRSTRKSWWQLAYSLDCNRHQEPDFNEVGLHPDYVSDQLANRFIGECSIRLADLYHTKYFPTPHGKKMRSLEHDTLLSELDYELPNFAKIPTSDQFRRHQQIARAYRKHEPVRADFADTPLVLLGEQAFEGELTGKKTTTHLVDLSGKRHPIEDVKSYVTAIAKLSTFGEWGKAKPPARSLAMARAIQAESSEGFAFTANFPLKAFSEAQSVERETGSEVQDQLRRLLIAEFGLCPDFYFLIERGLGQLPHLHGAIALEATPTNRNRLRKVLLSLTRAGNRTASERWVHVVALRTPARWAAYAYKHPLTSQMKTGVKTILRATNSLRRKARDVWGVMREEQRDARSIIKRVDQASSV